MKEVLKNVLPLLLIVGGVGSCIALIYSRKEPAREVLEAVPPSVEIEPVVRHTGALKLSVDGVAAPFREITLSAEIAGRITFKSDSCRAGRYVAKGEKLLTIDPRDYEIEVLRLVEELAQARSARKELEVEIANHTALQANNQRELRLMHEALEREQQLNAATASSRSQIEVAERAMLTSENRLIELNNKIRLLEESRTRLDSAIALAETKLDRAKLDLDRTEIVSPVDGVVVEEFIEQDALAQKGATLVTIEDTSAIEVKCNLESEELYWIWSQAEQFQPKDRYDLPPLKATVCYEAGGRKYEWNGKLSRYDGIGFDQRTRMVPCRVLVEDPFAVNHPTKAGGAVGPGAAPIVPALMRGMFVQVELELQPTEHLLSVNQRAIQPTGEVIVVAGEQKVSTGEALEETGKARMVTVKVLHYDDKRAIVLSSDDSLQVGDRVVITPLPGVSPYELRAGTVKVRIKSADVAEGETL